MRARRAARATIYLRYEGENEPAKSSLERKCRSSRLSLETGDTERNLRRVIPCNVANSGSFIGYRQKGVICTRLVGGGGSRGRTRLHVRFPVTREDTGKSLRFGLSLIFCVSLTVELSWSFPSISLRERTGKF